MLSMPASFFSAQTFSPKKTAIDMDMTVTVNCQNKCIGFANSWLAVESWYTGSTFSYDVHRLTQHLSGGLGCGRREVRESGSVRAQVLASAQPPRCFPNFSTISAKAATETPVRDGVTVAQRAPWSQTGECPLRVSAAPSLFPEHHVTERGVCSDRHGCSGTARKALKQ